MVLQRESLHEFELDDNTSYPLALAGSLVATGLAVTLVCPHPATQGLGWSGTAAVTVRYISSAAAVHAAAVVAVRNLFREHMRAQVTRLLWAIWIPIAWLPLLSVLTVRNSAWVLAVLPVLSLAATVLLTQERVQTSLESIADPLTGSFLLPPAEPLFFRTLAPSLATAAALQAGFVAAVADHEWFAGLLLSLGCVLPAWRLLERTRGWGTIRTAAVTSVVVLLLTWVALLPMLLSAQAGLGLPRLAHAFRASGSGQHTSAGTGYSGIILLPPLPKHKLLTTPPDVIHSSFSARVSEPTVIPFEGQYWCFKAPDARPRPDARVVHADPLKANVRSTDPLPLSMEAHQLFPLPLRLGKASILRLDVVNADLRPGAITISVLLHPSDAPRGMSVLLGSLVLPSSTTSVIGLEHAPVHEALRFAIPDRLRGRSTDEISVRLLSAPSRAIGAAKVSVQDFALLP